MTTLEKRQIVEQITKEFADRGMIMEGGWKALLALDVPPGASDLQKSEMRKAYFYGAQHLFASILSIMEPGTEPTEKDMNRVTLISKELERFADKLKKEEQN